MGCLIWILDVLCLEVLISLFDGLGVTGSLLDPRFAGSNPNKLDGFFQDVKILSTSSPGEQKNILEAKGEC